MNNCVFSGKIVRDAESKVVASGTTVTKFTIANDNGFGDKKRTEFINLVMFKREGVVPHLTKGKAVIVSCEFQDEKWEKDGQKHSRPSFIVRDIDFQQASTQQPPQTQSPSVRDDMNNVDPCPF